jgi:hypothetical protein
VPGFFDHLTASVAFVRPRRLPLRYHLDRFEACLRRVESIQELSPAILSA